MPRVRCLMSLNTKNMEKNLMLEEKEKLVKAYVHNITQAITGSNEGDMEDDDVDIGAMLVALSHVSAWFITACEKYSDKNKEDILNAYIASITAYVNLMTSRK